MTGGIRQTFWRRAGNLICAVLVAIGVLIVCEAILVAGITHRAGFVATLTDDFGGAALLLLCFMALPVFSVPALIASVFAHHYMSTKHS